MEEMLICLDHYIMVNLKSVACNYFAIDIERSVAVYTVSRERAHVGTEVETYSRARWASTNKQASFYAIIGQHTSYIHARMYTPANNMQFNL
jgi:hypothetical protein